MDRGQFECYAGLAAGRCRYTITPVIADAFINCRVTAETKALVRRLAERDGIAESTLVKQLLDVVLRTATLTDLPVPAVPDKVNREARLYVRLEPEDWTLLRERSKARGMASATYVSHLVRSHLRGVAPLPQAEYLAFKQAVVELTTIGRNLNQIARAMNQGGRPALPGRAELETMLNVADALRVHFKALLKSNARAWRGDAEAH